MSPRRARIAPGGYWYHVGNRAVDRRRILSQDADFQHFLELLGEAKSRYDVRCAAYTPMPNHFHLVVNPESGIELSAFMKHLQGRFACDLRSSTQTRGNGHVYQDRFWNFPIGSEPHFVRVLRYVEGNALRARLVDHAEDWRWGSLWERVRGERALLDDLPIRLPADWLEIVNVGCTERELKDLRSPVKRGRPRKEKGDSPLFS